MGTALDRPLSLLFCVHSSHRETAAPPCRARQKHAILEFWRTSRSLRDPLTNRAVSSRTVHTNWDKRREVRRSALGSRALRLDQGRSPPNAHTIASCK